MILPERIVRLIKEKRKIKNLFLKTRDTKLKIQIKLKKENKKINKNNFKMKLKKSNRDVKKPSFATFHA